LYFAERLPASKVTGFSNSRTQKEYIEAEAARRNLKNVEIITGDVADYEFEPAQFDRVVSVEVRIIFPALCIMQMKHMLLMARL
jgi:cyclopropane fatty-acyl-phospholipid synthase-like methyltransferase